jgi:ligand-binding sensor domain-containing protein
MGNMWLGTYAAGVEFLPKIREKFTHYKRTNMHGEGLNNNIVKAIQEDSDGNLWLATDGGGINFFNKSRSLKHKFLLSSLCLILPLDVCYLHMHTLRMPF